MCNGQDKQQNHQQMAQSEGKQGMSATETAKQGAVQEAVNVGNKICPVTDAEIDEKLKATYEYEGKIYNFCCADCIEEFKKNPEKYIKKIEEQKQAQPEEEKSKLEPGASHHNHQMP
ncbi:MAG: hypothetical protein A3K83_05630 [Omnitrophica WOR_2 bacterium RBG_13_44_8b]|nr:MAG: hypothetical protein A3K83_05630 [Omnitrophica WOR_2 bacterium RBG_13_44_8b]